MKTISITRLSGSLTESSNKQRKEQIKITCLPTTLIAKQRIPISKTHIKNLLSLDTQLNLIPTLQTKTPLLKMKTQSLENASTALPLKKLVFQLKDKRLPKNLRKNKKPLHLTASSHNLKTILVRSMSKRELPNSNLNQESMPLIGHQMFSKIPLFVLISQLLFPLLK